MDDIHEETKVINEISPLQFIEIMGADNFMIGSMMTTNSPFKAIRIIQGCSVEIIETFYRIDGPADIEFLTDKDRLKATYLTLKRRTNEQIHRYRKPGRNSS